MSKSTLRLKISGLALALTLTVLALGGLAMPAYAAIAGTGGYSPWQTPYCQFQCQSGATGFSSVASDYANCRAQCQSLCGGPCLILCTNEPGWC